MSSEPPSTSPVVTENDPIVDKYRGFLYDLGKVLNISCGEINQLIERQIDAKRNLDFNAVVDQLRDLEEQFNRSDTEQQIIDVINAYKTFEQNLPKIQTYMGKLEDLFEEVESKIEQMNKVRDTATDVVLQTQAQASVEKCAKIRVDVSTFFKKLQRYLKDVETAREAAKKHFMDKAT